MSETLGSQSKAASSKRSSKASDLTKNGVEVGSSSMLTDMDFVRRYTLESTDSLNNYLSASQSVESLSPGQVNKEETPKSWSLGFSSEESSRAMPIEEFPINVTPIMNDTNLWGCFYNFPELYEDAYSPVVRFDTPEDVQEPVDGILTRKLIKACLTYLRRVPIIGDFAYIKLDLSSKHLVNIDALRSYKFLIYLDLSSNYLTELHVLSYLPYLQYLSVSFNRLYTVLDYETPQWFLTEVHYKYNSVEKIRDLSMFWSIAVLDLSHNNIKRIDGLENLHFLRILDLSFNHIQRLKNLNNLRLTWLDVSYNNISSFELSDSTGLWTLQHLEFLNINENNLTSMKIFLGCTRLQELHARNNRLGELVELTDYLRQFERLVNLDLRANPICTVPGYKQVVVEAFPKIRFLDAQELEPVEQTFPVKKDRNQFPMECECLPSIKSKSSKAEDSAVVKTSSSVDYLENACKIEIEKSENGQMSLHSLYIYKEPGNDEFPSEVGGSTSVSKKSGDGYQSTRTPPPTPPQDKLSESKSVNTRGMSGASKSYKSVAFPSQDTEPSYERRQEFGQSGHETLRRGLTGLVIEPPMTEITQGSKSFVRSVSKKLADLRERHENTTSTEEGDLSLSFLVKTGLLQASDPIVNQASSSGVQQAGPRHKDAMNADDLDCNSNE